MLVVFCVATPDVDIAPWAGSRLHRRDDVLVERVLPYGERLRAMRAAQSIDRMLVVFCVATPDVDIALRAMRV